jgi:ubiquitin-conjugating enzyme E2 M
LLQQQQLSWPGTHPLSFAILGLQDKQKQAAAAAATGKPKQSAGELRLQKGMASCAAVPGSIATAADSAQLQPDACCMVVPADLTELQLPSNININFPEGREKPMHFEITIKPDEGYYRCGWPAPATEIAAACLRYSCWSCLC